METICVGIRDLNKFSAISSLLEVVCRVTGLQVAIIAQVTEAQWVACSVRDEMSFGIMPGDTLPAEFTICAEVKERASPIIINDLTADPVHARKPIIVDGQFRSYISVPIVLAVGTLFGTLCAFGIKPATLDTPEILGMFKLFAGLVADQINSENRLEASAVNLRSATSKLDISETGRQNAEADLAVSAASLTDTTLRLAASDAALLDANATAELREQFVAILGHDLRNPISSIGSGISLLRRSPQDERSTRILDMMEKSTVRMGELVRNMLDFARTQLGGGIALHRQPFALEPVLHHAVAELRDQNSNQAIIEEFNLTRPVDCDPDRLGQMLSNLLSNALTHGATGHPVTIRAGIDAGTFTLSVSNSGRQIPPENMVSLFKPYVRGNPGNVHGLGLGLHIAAGIAKAHGGILAATSTPQETRFTFEMPVAS